MKLILLRYFIVPAEYTLFQTKKDPGEIKGHFTSEFLKDQDFRSAYGVEHTLAGNSKVDDRYYFGKLGKKRLTDVPVKVGKDIQEVSEEQWPYINYICDTQEQIFFIEDPQKIQRSIISLCKLLSEFVSAKLLNIGYEVKFQSIVQKGLFWSTIEAFDKLFMVKLNLSSPNMFGARVAANESLKETEGKFNNTSVSLTFRNPQGNLKMPKDEIGSYIDYCEKGGGDWTVSVSKVQQPKSKGKRKAKPKNGPKQAIKSTSSAMNLSVAATDFTNPASVGQLLTELQKNTPRIED